jgi:protein-tyrosine phosphatase
MQAVPKTVLFLCTGNYYRSRFAEILFNSLAEKHVLPWRATSRGVAIEFGIDNVGPISSDTLRKLQALGIPADGYLRSPLQVAEADLEQADLVVALKEAEHRPLLQARFPAWAERVEYWHVHDIDYGPVAEALADIEREVTALVGRLLRAGRFGERGV